METRTKKRLLTDAILKRNGFIKTASFQQYIQRIGWHVLFVWDRKKAWTVDFRGAHGRFKLLTKIRFAEELEEIFNVLDLWEFHYD